MAVSIRRMNHLPTVDMLTTESALWPSPNVRVRVTASEAVDCTRLIASTAAPRRSALSVRITRVPRQSQPRQAGYHDGARRRASPAHRAFGEHDPRVERDEGEKRVQDHRHPSRPAAMAFVAGEPPPRRVGGPDEHERVIEVDAPAPV